MSDSFITSDSFFIVTDRNLKNFNLSPGLCAQDILLPLLWNFVRGLGPSCGIKTLLDLLSQSPNNAKVRNLFFLRS